MPKVRATTTNAQRTEYVVIDGRTVRWDDERAIYHRIMRDMAKLVYGTNEEKKGK